MAHCAGGTFAVSKLRKWGVFFAIVLATLVSIVLTALTLHRSTMREHGTITSEELDALSADWDEQVTSAEPSPARVAAGTVATEPEPEASRELPALRRTYSEAERDRLAERMRGAGSSVSARLSVEFTSLLATGCASAGLDDGTGYYLFDAGRTAYMHGDFGTARQYLSEAVRCPLSKANRQDACMMLATLVDDVALSDRLLQEACPPGESSLALYDAVTYALRVGDADLFQYYLQRFQHDEPQLAEQFDADRVRVESGGAISLDPREP